MTDEKNTPSPIDRLLDQERQLLQRLEPRQAEAAVRAGGVIVDTRSHEQRVAGGVVPGSIRVHRNVLEWRVDPSSDWYDQRFAAYSGPLIVMCQQGYSSSLAAATLQRLGLRPRHGHGRRLRGLGGGRPAGGAAPR